MGARFTPAPAGADQLLVPTKLRRVAAGPGPAVAPAANAGPQWRPDHAAAT